VGKHDHAAAVCVCLKQRTDIDNAMKHAVRENNTNVKQKKNYNNTY
jgi:hypothetical protein